MSSVIVLTLVLTLTPAHPAPSVPKLPNFTPVVEVVTQLVELADQATTRQGGPDVKVPRYPTLEAVQLRVVYRIARVEVADYLTNEVVGVEVPGRRITATVCIDVLVNCTLDVGKVLVRQDPDYPEITEVLLPAPKVTTEFPEGELADYTVEYAGLRLPFLNREVAAELRTRMYSKAKEKACELYAKEVQPALQSNLVRDLQGLLRKQFPGKRIYVRFSL
jgi:hypothetical protein